MYNILYFSCNDCSMPVVKNMIGLEGVGLIVSVGVTI